MSAGARSFIGRLIGAPAQPLVELVALNLENVLNTRKGAGSVIREFGLGDYEDAPNTHEAVLVLLDEIPEQCRRYEPRLHSPQLSILGRAAVDVIRFELSGELGGGPQLFWLDMNTQTRSVVITIIKGMTL